MEEEVVRPLACMHETGKYIHNKYVAQVLEELTLPITNTIKRQNVLTFSNRSVTSRKGGKSGSEQRNTSLVTKLFLSLQSHPDADVREFFLYENQKEPPSLSTHGSLRSGKKSDILECLKVPSGCGDGVKDATVIIMDMAAVVHIVWPTAAQTFLAYVANHLVPYLQSQISPQVTRMDAIWDNYPENNLKSITHQRRGIGPRTRIGDGQTRIPKHDWSSGFLKNTENKKELFPFLSKQIIKSDMKGVLLLSTNLENVLSNRTYDVSALQPCNHAEADTTILLLLAHAAQHGHRKAVMEIKLPFTFINTNLTK